jgi:hypothetical protein
MPRLIDHHSFVMPALDAGIQGRKYLSLLPWIAGSGPGNDVKWVLITRNLV